MNLLPTGFFDGASAPGARDPSKERLGEIDRGFIHRDSLLPARFASDATKDLEGGE